MPIQYLLPNLSEVLAGSNPFQRDTDLDAIPDGVEAVIGWAILDSDQDKDGSPDGLKDSDEDGLPDHYELFHGMDPVTQSALADTDGDRWPDIWEFKHGTRPDRQGQEPNPLYPQASLPLCPAPFPIVTNM